jgi:glutamyl-tRNA synthetase
MREAQRLANQKPQYNRRHRPATSEPQQTQLPAKNDAEPFVIRLRAPIDGETTFSDIILGQVTTRNEELDDFVIIRSDGTPTYNFTVVVDDIDMKISHVIRGMDHVSNTPKQMLIYHALGVTPPEFAHLPMILGADKKKLSKRHGATSVIEYKKDGYLSDAFVNYLARLGWSHGDQEIFTRHELEQFFSLDSTGKSAAVFDFEKLLWVNAEHLKTASAATIIDGLTEFLPKETTDISRLRDDVAFLKLIDSLRARAKTLKDIAEGCHWYLSDDAQFQVAEEAAAQHLTESAKKALGHLLTLLQALPNFDETEIESAFKQTAAELET